MELYTLKLLSLSRLQIPTSSFGTLEGRITRVLQYSQLDHLNRCRGRCGSCRSRVRGRGGWDLALKTEAGQPGSIVELGIVGNDLLTVIADDELVDTYNTGLGEWSKVPSPGDGVATIPGVERFHRNFGLSHALAGIEGGLVGECRSTKLQRCQQVSSS